jgi:hypothetical protein
VEYDENGDDEDSEAEQGEAEGCERARQSDRYLERGQNLSLD